MISDIRNGCKDELTFECYNKVSTCVHIHSYSMYAEQDGGEVVSVGFDQYQQTFVGYVNPLTSMVELYELINYHVGGEGDDSEPITDYYGVAQLDSLLAELNKMPHIANVLEDSNWRGEIH